jgi:cation:H+ antiporter
MDFLILILGLAILIVGGEILVKGAVALALRFNVSVLVVGMTVVSFGTSAPELLVSIKAALGGHPDISMGNVVGSNIANISLILGLTTIILPITVNRNSIIIDWPIMMLASLLLYAFIYNGILGPIEGALMFLSLIVFNLWLIFKSRKENRIAADLEGIELEPQSSMSLLKSISFIIIGCVGLVFGADWFLKGAVGIAEDLGISERIIALTIVAFGTSVPELITSVIAAFRKQTDISIGNLIGSNLFNILGILGITGMVKEINVSSDILHSDMIWMLVVSFLVLPLMYFGKQFGRVKGALLFVFYLSYMFFLIS